MSKKQFVKDLKLDTIVDSYFVITEIKYYKFTDKSREKERFVRLLLSDVSGSIKSILWNGSLAKKMALSPGVVIQVRGEVGDYNNSPQVVVNSLQVLSEEKIDRYSLQKSSARKTDEMLKRLFQIIEKEITQPDLKSLIESFFEDKNFSQTFSLSPAARKVHHNYLGGLLEHSLEVAEFCLLMLKLYPGKLNASLLLTGAILHDVGKIEEYDLKSISFNLTDRGKLIGHIAIGLEKIRKKCESLERFPFDLQTELEHMILAHHGQKEWGSPEVPKTFNAFALFYADLTSARLSQFEIVAAKGDGAEKGWTEWDRLLGRSVYLGK